MGWGEGGESCLRVAVRLSCGTVCVAVVVWGPVVRKSWGGRSSFLWARMLEINTCSTGKFIPCDSSSCWLC